MHEIWCVFLSTTCAYDSKTSFCESKTRFQHALLCRYITRVRVCTCHKKVASIVFGRRMKRRGNQARFTIYRNTSKTVLTADPIFNEISP